MKVNIASSLIITLTLGLQTAMAADVAKVILMRGMVKAKLASGSVVDVKADQSLSEGATLQTAEKSFVKLLFIDKSEMNLGPNSQMVINSFPKKEAGIITLVKGEIKSKVTKDYMEMDDKSKSKLYIKTKTAAMGIRGTHFQVNFNPENHNTSLVTFEGKVAMASIEKKLQTERFDQNVLEKVVSSDKAVMVVKGQISAVNLNVAERAMLPTTLGTKQFQALESNETGMKESSGDESKKQFKNPIPPGADGAAFSNTPVIMNNLPKTAVDIDTSNPNGYFNAQTGEYKLPAGSIIDLNTVNIIPPPANAVFDANSNTFVVPESYGKIDKVTGEYKAPEGLKLGHDGKFELVDADAYQKAQNIGSDEEKKEDKKEDKKDDKKEDKKDDKKEDKKDSSSDKKESAPETAKADAPKEAKEGERAPASVGPAGPPPVNVKIEVPKIYDARPDMADFSTKFAASPIAPPPPLPMNTQFKDLATAVMNKNETVRQTNTDLGIVSPQTKVKIILNAQ
jgi:hypothetical protein